MKTTRFFLATFVSGVGVFAIAEACGGQLGVGYDDAGNYHTPEGGVLKPGSACTDFDAAHYVEDGGYACDLANSMPAMVRAVGLVLELHMRASRHSG